VKIQIAKYGVILTSRPSGRDAALNFIAYSSDAESMIKAVLDFENVDVLTPSWLSEFVQTLKSRGVKEIQFVSCDNPTVSSSIEAIEGEY
jgi:hypothetical protein